MPETRWPFAVTIHADPQSDRYRNWMETFGTETIPVQSPFPVKSTTPDHPGGALFFKCQVRLLGPLQLERVVRHLAAEFGETEGEVRDSLFGEHGLPILATDVTVTTEGLWFL